MKVSLLLSGGVDSSVLLAWLRSRADAGGIVAITVDYGQRHRRELWSAFQVARYYGAQDVRLSVPPELLAGSSLTGTPGATKGANTVVPGRNLLFVALAVAESIRREASALYIGPHAGDAVIYPDCRPAFVRPLAEAALAGYGVKVVAPFLGKSKAEIVALGRELSVPFDMTWSCYDPADHDPLAPASGRPCGNCGACRARGEAFA